MCWYGNQEDNSWLTFLATKKVTLGDHCWHGNQTETMYWYGKQPCTGMVTKMMMMMMMTITDHNNQMVTKTICLGIPCIGTVTKKIILD